MTSLSVKSLLAGAALLAAPAALADIYTSAPAFDAKIAAARVSTSPGGTTVIRSEMSGALDEFWYDDWMVDVDEHDYLGEQLSDPYFVAGINASAQDLGWDFYELNDGQWAENFDFWRVTTPASVLFGANGPLAWSSSIGEGYSEGVVNQDTLQYAYYTALVQGYEDQFLFSPITDAEMVQRLSGRTMNGTPTQAEVNGAANYLRAVAGDGERFYSAEWHSNFWGGESAGYVIAAVDDNREVMRMVRVIVWGD